MSYVKDHLYNVLVAPLNDYEQRVSELFDVADRERIEHFIKELEDYGVACETHIDDSYYGCYPSVQDFVEDFCNECYSEVINEMPAFMQTALDYELMWYHTFQHDFFTIYDRDSGEYYFFNRNF